MFTTRWWHCARFPAACKQVKLPVRAWEQFWEEWRLFNVPCAWSASPERSGGCSMVHVLGARRKLIGKGIINLGIFHMIGKTPWICQSGILDIKRQLKRPDSLKDFPVLSSIVFQPLGERWLIKRRDLRTFGDEKQAWKIGRVQPLTQVNIL